MSLEVIASLTYDSNASPLETKEETSREEINNPNEAKDEAGDEDEDFVLLLKRSQNRR